jgi:hypothetical protein
MSGLLWVDGSQGANVNPLLPTIRKEGSEFFNKNRAPYRSGLSLSLKETEGPLGH